jgi:acetolactate decarboxylase
MKTLRFREVNSFAQTEPHGLTSRKSNPWRYIYQISTSSALVEGVDSGLIASSALLEHGNFGLGTFDGLNGEMVILDGEIFQIEAQVRKRMDDFLVPFAAITQFTEDTVFRIEKVASLNDVESACDKHRHSDNLFYALRLDGLFESIRARAVHPASKKTRLLEAAKTQLQFRLQHIEGTLVCFWSPKYASSFSVPGYHFHFISKDRTKGGHVLDCAANELRGGIQIVSEYRVRLPESGPFLTTDLSRDPRADLAKAE